MRGDINKAYSWAVETCNMTNPYALYTQNTGRAPNRYGTKDSSGNVYYDCSSFIAAALTYGGFFKTNPWFATSNERSYLLQAGFKKVDRLGHTKPGDIGWNNGHTEMCYKAGTGGGGVFMGAHTSHASLANQVCIGSSSTGQPYNHAPWQELYRYGDGASGKQEPISKCSIYAFAAMCGNWQTESNVNPGVWEGLHSLSRSQALNDSVYGGYGLGQWTSGSFSWGTLTRRSKLLNWLDDNGYDWDSAEGQLKYLIAENYWSHNGHGSNNYADLKDFLNSSSTDVRELAGAYLAGWEGIWNGTQNNRMNQAEHYLSLLQEHGDETRPWHISNNYLSQSQMDDNAINLWQLMKGLNVGDGEDDNPSEGDKKDKGSWWVYLVANKIIR